MKTIIRIFAVVTLAVSFGAVSAFAQTSRSLAATIPFDFNVGQRSFTSGSYRIHVTTTDTGCAVVKIIDDKSRRVGIILGTVDGNASLGSSELVFDRTGNRHSLRGVVLAGFGITLPVTREKKLVLNTTGMADRIVVPIASVN